MAEYCGTVEVWLLVQMAHDGTPRPPGDRLSPKDVLESLEPQKVGAPGASPPRRAHEASEPTNRVMRVKIERDRTFEANTGVLKA